MSTALAGIIGVIAGALVTGAAQLWLSSLQRRNDALAACRLTWGALADAVSTLESSIQEKEWAIAAAAVIDRGLDVWEKNRMAVARSVDAFQYRTLEVAFMRLRETREQAGAFDRVGLEGVSNDPRMPADLFYFEKARATALKASQTRWQRITGPRKSKRMELELQAVLASLGSRKEPGDADAVDGVPAGG